jgi:hypothetical protein
VGFALLSVFLLGLPIVGFALLSVLLLGLPIVCFALLSMLFCLAFGPFFFLLLFLC